MLPDDHASVNLLVAKIVYSLPWLQIHLLKQYIIYLFLMEIHSMQGQTATTRHGVKKKKKHKKIKANRKSV